MKAPQPSLEPRPEAPAPEAEATPPKPVEPWTPERVIAWNAYYDIYVTLGVLLLAFLTSAVRVTNSSIWADLRAGQLILKRGPITGDVFSYTAEGARWVDLSWLYQAAIALLYGLGGTLFASDPPKADRVGVMAVVAANAAVRMLTLLVLLGLRRKGPGLWWVAVCAALGLWWIAPAPLSSGNWGLLLLATELLLLHQAIDLGRKGAGWALVPLFALWANVDPSFLIGLYFLGAAALAGGVPIGKPVAYASAGWSRAQGLMVFVACAAACVLNPSHVMAFPVALGVTMADFALPFGKLAQARAHAPGASNTLGLLAAIYAVLVGAGLYSFWLNRKRPSPARLAIFGATALLTFAMYAGLRAEFAVVLAAVVAMNGQEWYLSRFGTAGRVGKGWASWSVGGRLVTIASTTAALGLALTGYGSLPGDPAFGFGYDPDDFALESAEYLRTAPIQGKVLNTSRSLGDTLLWKAYPARKSYVDGRQGVFPSALDAELKELRESLRDGEPDRWRPILDRRGIDVVMLNREEGPGLRDASPRTYDALMARPDEWIPFYTDGNVVLFGRADADAADLAYFRANRLDADEMAFVRGTPVRGTPQPPTPTSSLDSVFWSKKIATTQPHARAAYQWLHPEGGDDPSTLKIPDLARCFLAIREARTALARDKPDDTFAYRILAESYKWLLFQEAQTLGRGPSELGTGWLGIRQEQRATALNFAIMTTPPPDDTDGRNTLAALNRELAGLYETIHAYDLARDRLAAVRALTPPGDFDPGEQKILSRLDAAIEETKRKMAEPSDDPRAGPLRRFNLAIGSGMTGMAIAELLDVEKQGMNPAIVKARLIDLLCQVGQPDRALEQLQQGDINDPALETEPGMSQYRHARVYLLMGQYDASAGILQQAIARLQSIQTQRSLESFTQGSLKGDFKLTTRSVEEVVKLVATRATWEGELGQVLLESGETKLAADSMVKALTLAPKLNIRPILAYYLGRMGREVPAITPASNEAQPSPVEPKKATNPAPAPGELPEDVFATSKT